MSSHKKSSSFAPSLEHELATFISAIDSLAETLPLTTQAIEEARKLAIDKIVKNLLSLVKISSKADEIANEMIRALSRKSKDLQPNGDKSISIPLDPHLDSTIQFIKSMRYGHKLSTASRLVQRSFLMSLISQYDAFLGGIIRNLFLIQPESLNVSEKNIAFSQLQTFNTIEEAREYIIEKEVEYGGPKSQDSFWAKIRQNSAVRETRGYPFRYTCAGV